MRKKIFSIILCIMLCLSLLPMTAFAAVDMYVEVNGVELTGENLTVACGNGTATYDPQTFTLTLDNAEITKSKGDFGAILTDSSVRRVVTINLVGDNSINVEKSYGIYGINANYKITGSGNLVIDSEYAGICTPGIGDEKPSVTIDMEGDLTIRAGKPTENSMWKTGIYSHSVMISGSGNVVIQSEAAGGISVEDTVTISGAGDVSIDSVESAAIGTNSGDVFIAGSGAVTCSSEKFYAVVPGGEMLLNGSNTPVRLTAGTGYKAVYRHSDSSSPVAGTNLAAYICVKGAPEEKSVVYRLEHNLINCRSNGDATCTEDGTKIGECTNCEVTDTVTDEGSATGHSFANYVSDNNATCTEDGTKTAKCDRCEETDTMTDEDSATGHSFTSYVSDENATCTEDGTKTRVCEYCGEMETVTDEGSATGHSFTNYVSDENATCTEDGTKTAVCEQCGVTDTVPDEGSATGHSFANYVSDNNATCTEDGTKTAKCSKCEATDTVTDEGSAAGHSFTTKASERKASEATCITAASYYVQCDNCSEVDMTSTVASGEPDPAAHDWDEWVSADSSKHTRVCKNDASHIETENHSFSGRTCSVCSYKKPASSGSSSAGSTSSGSSSNEAPSLPFEDVKESDWSYEDILYAYESGTMQGLSDTTFGPKLSTSRAMIVTVLWRLEGEPVVNYAMSFADVAADQWYTEAIRWAQANGIVEGYSSEKFGTNDPITREQMAAIFYRYAGFKELDVSARADMSVFADSSQISDWAADAVAWAKAKDLVNGVGNDQLSPRGHATREQVVALLHRFCENILK